MGVWRLVLVALALTACGSDASAATLQGPVTYGKSGGIAGLMQKLTVQADGRAVASSGDRKRSFTLTKAQLNALTRAVTKADLAHTKSTKQRSQGADAFEYGLSYRGDRVRWSDFTDPPPERVQKLYRLLDDLYERHAPCPANGRSC